MKWFKHDSNANMDAKLQEVLLDYGLEGYGLYWYCIELITNKVDKDNITFSLEHDARIIARNTGCSPQKVTEMMKYFIQLGLFENADGVITCLKLAKRLDKSMTSNPEMRKIIQKFNDSNSDNHDGVMTNREKIKNSHDAVMTKSETVMQDQIRLDQTRLERSKDISSAFDVFWFSGMKKTEKPTALASFKKVLSKPIDSPLSEKPKKLKPLEFANFLKQDIEMRLSSGQLGFDKLAPHRYLNKQRWNDDYENNSTERRASTPASRSIEAAKKLCG